MGSMKILKAAAALIALLHMALLALRSQSVLQLAQRLLPAVASQVGISLTAEWTVSIMIVSYLVAIL